MDPALQRALDPVLRDLRSTGAPLPRLDSAPRGPADGPWLHVMLWGRTGGAGVVVDPAATELGQRLVATEQVQEWAVEELWTHGRSTNWPRCPHHPRTHPLKPAERDGRACWVCPVDAGEIAPIGELGPTS